MIVGTLECSVTIRQARSLKDKRSAIKSLKDRLRNRFNISIAEIDAHDRRQLAVLGVAVVTTERRHAESVLSQVVDFVRAFGRVELCDYTIDTF